jgi:uncharacterized protein (UPF0333 family)
MSEKIKNFIYKMLSVKGQISMEFSILMLAGLVAAVVAGYYLIISSKDIGDANIDTINHTYNTTMGALNKV